MIEKENNILLSTCPCVNCRWCFNALFLGVLESFSFFRFPFHRLIFLSKAKPSGKAVRFRYLQDRHSYESRLSSQQGLLSFLHFTDRYYISAEESLKCDSLFFL